MAARENIQQIRNVGHSEVWAIQKAKAKAILAQES